MNWDELVAEFHRARGNYVPIEPQRPNMRIIALRLRLMMEELGELTVAMHQGTDPVEILDGLCDLLYVTVGTAVEYGYGPILDDAFREVHRSNMTKDHAVQGDGLKYGASGTKGSKYEPPNLAQFLVIDKRNK